MQCPLLQVIVVAWGAGVESSTAMRDVSAYPACVTDEDCLDVSEQKQEDFKCFQYMCYPWNSREEHQREGAFRTCKRRSDCQHLLQEEGGEGDDGDCYRHPNRRTVHTGICLDMREIVPCFDHASCEPPLKCTNGVCGDGEYFKALRDMECQDDDLCQDLLLGSQCCFDVQRGVESWARGGAEDEWGKTCCDNKFSPVTRPRDNLTRKEIAKLSKKIHTFYSPWGLDQIICEGLDYHMMVKLSSCQEFTTTTTPVPTTTTSTTTTPSRRTTTKTVINKSRHQVTADSPMPAVLSLCLHFVVLGFTWL